jgi:DNA-binding MarR family transcriptional regulator
MERRLDHTERELEHGDYARLLGFRTGLRRFLHWSEQQAVAAGLTPAQHQLLLAIRGHDDPLGPTVGDAAGYLLLRHHSAVELIDRAVAAGLVRRRSDPADQRQVRLELTAKGAERLAHLSALHLEELERLGAALRPLTDNLGVAPPAKP